MNQFVELKRLGDVIRRTALHDRDGVLDGGVAGDDDRDDARITLAGRLDYLGPVDPRQTQVGHEHVEGELIEILQRFFAGGRLSDFKPALGEPLRHEAAQSWLIVTKSRWGVVSDPSTANRLTQTTVPTYPWKPRATGSWSSGHNAPHRQGR